VSFLYVTFIPESVDVSQVSELTGNFYPLGWRYSKLASSLH
jgi:hypothetical protein